MPEPTRSPASRRLIALAALAALALALGVRPGRADDPPKKNGKSPLPREGTFDPAVVAEIDRRIDARVAEAKVEASPPADDSEFLRRVWLDVGGVIPPAEAVERFCADKDPRKRAKAIDELLASEAYVEHFSSVFANAIIGRAARRRDRYYSGRFEDWLSQRIGENAPYDQVVRELLTADGFADDDPATGFFVRHDGNPMDLAGQTARLFLGVRIQCAQCHDHPYAQWKQEDFYGMAAFFARTKIVRVPKMEGQPPRFGVHDVRHGELRLPPKGAPQDQGAKTGEVIAPRFITGETIEAALPAGAAKPGRLGYGGPVRREALASLVTSAKNPYFGRAAVNRIWALLLGRGFVEPIDDFAPGDNGSHPELLEFLAKDFVEHGCDLKRLLRQILRSRTYQRSSRVTASNAEEKDLFSRARLKPIPPEPLFESLLQATGMDRMARARMGDQYKENKGRFLQQFIFVFGDDEMEEVESYDGTIPQALMLLNGRLVNEGVLPRPGNAIEQVLREEKDPGRRLDRIFLAALSRYPTEAERSRLLELVRGEKDRGAACEDVFFALLNSSEFIFNH